VEENKSLKREIETTQMEFSKYKSTSSQLHASNQQSIQTSARDNKGLQILSDRLADELNALRMQLKGNSKAD
jgi:hypothetical protein